MADEDLIEKAHGLYDAMEKAYDAVAAHYGFSCEGCKDNCCVQRFFHYTHIEYMMLKEGMTHADPQLRERIFGRANMVVSAYMKELEAGELLPLMCPVNEGGDCMLYEHRPMTCRLHGMPFQAPSREGEQLGEGCARFTALHPEPDIRLERGLFYPEMAKLEMECRMRIGAGGGRYSKTTAEMLMEMSGDFEPPESEDAEPQED